MAGTLDILGETRKELEEWECNRMDILVATSFTDGTLVTINFSDTIGHSKHAPKPEKRDDSNCIWLDPEWRENSDVFRSNTIIPFFVSAASKAGFRISGGWEPKYNVIQFRCIRGKRNDQHKNQKDALKQRPKKKLKKPNAQPIPRNKRTQRPLKPNQAEDPELQEEATLADIETCKLNFRIYWDDYKDRWFIPRKQSGCRRHNGHPYIEHPLLRIQPRHSVTATEIDVVETALDSKIAVCQTAALVQTRTGINLDWNQINYMNTKQKNDLLASDKYSTSADKLSVILSQPGSSSVCLFAEYNSNLLTIKQLKKSSKSTTTEESTFDADLGDMTETPRMFASSLEGTVRDNLTNSSTGQILRLAVWTHDTARRKLDMYPEFVSIDDTEGTNAEERPLHDWCAKDANNKVFPFLLAFLPSKAQWAYTFVCRAAGALNLGPSLCRTIKINSDADKEETRAICNAIGKNRKKQYKVAPGRQSNNDIVLPVYKKQKHSPPLSSLLSTLSSNSDTRILPNAQQGWCGFHKVDRNFTSNVEYRGLLDAARDKDIFGNVEIDVIVRWMWYFIKYYRNMEEVEMSAFFSITT